MTTINPSIYTVGLTGGIASGKSSATRHFESLGVPVVDADLVAREVVEPGTPGLQALIETFGKSVLQPDGSLDRSELRTIIFDSPQSRTQLEAILHPAIRTRSAELVAQHAEEGSNYVICAVPLLVETGQSDRYDRTAVVDVSIDTQIARIIERDQATIDDAKKILAAQASREDRLNVADDVINNEGTLQELEDQVETLHQMYLTNSKIK